MIKILLLTTSHALGSFENVNDKISEMMDISTETNVKIKNMYHEFTQWKRNNNKCKHIFIFLGYVDLFRKLSKNY